jgi:hypothetical protein
VRSFLTACFWDSGSHNCVITSDVLSEGFLQYLTKAENDPYRDSQGTVVQVDGYVTRAW